MLGVERIAHTNDYFTEMCSGSEAGSYLRLIDFVYHSTLGLRVIKKKRPRRRGCGSPSRETDQIEDATCALCRQEIFV